MKPLIIATVHKLKFKIENSKWLRGKNLMISLLNLIIGKPKKPLILKTIHGFKMIIDPVTDIGVEKSIYWSGTYEIGTLNILKYLLKPGDVFYDVGSNIGLMSLFVANNDKSTRIFSFEPEPNTFKILRKNVELNSFNNIKSFDFAIGAEETEHKLYSNIEVNRGAASLVIKNSEEGYPVKVHTLDNVIHNLELPLPTIIKIDVEGYELEVLLGSREILSAVNAPVLCMEYSKETTLNHDVSELYNYLTTINKYKIFKFQKWKGFIGQLVEVTSLKEMPSNDNVFCFLDVHLEKIDKIIFKNPL